MRAPDRKFLRGGAVLAGLLVVLGGLWHWGAPRPRPAEVLEPEQALRRVGAPPEAPADDGEAEALLQALAESRRVLEARPEQRLVFGPDTVAAGEVARQLEEVEQLVRSGLGGQRLVEALLRRYRLYESAAGEGGVLFTGYYEASLRGSRTRHGPYQTPLYAMPDDVVTVDLGQFDPELSGKRVSGLLEGGRRLVPLPDRAAIARGALAGRGLELFWVDDPVEAFFLEIQGSGRLLLPDGSSVNVGYAGENGRPYRAIGKLLIDEGTIPREKMSAQALKAYLREHPDEQRRIFDYNPSAIFFRERRGPEGSTGAVVTGGRSIATDKRLFPPAALALVRTTRPVLDARGERVGSEPLVRLVLNQDTGGAIRGPGRVDLFTGFGPEAEAWAGHQNDRGSLYFLAPRARD